VSALSIAAPDVQVAACPLCGDAHDFRDGPYCAPRWCADGCTTEQIVASMAAELEIEAAGIDWTSP